MGKEKYFTNVAGTTRYLYGWEGEVNLDPYLILRTNIYSQWIIDLNIKAGTVNIL